ncbi:glycosyltransferase family 8 protein [Furfurilactobacillus entadae]|uniref:glycosyltransferase family 8 protein n=1 Tax=Furfurilactobacillus entadae TaxID=2922307 RepID=UPI0035E7F0EF
MSLINILVTLNQNYLMPLKTALTSLAANNRAYEFHIYLLHKTITPAQIQELSTFVQSFNWHFTAIQIDQVFDTQKITTIHDYPSEMYFRLLAGDFLPDDVSRIIYLDPDTLIINDLSPLWTFDLGDAMMAAASHTGLLDAVTPINNLRLNTEGKYYNTGVLLMDLNKTRQIIQASAIQQTIETYHDQLLLPDQDVLNHLYHSHIVEIPEEIWNYDTRQFMTYQIRSMGEHTLAWVMQQTVILHFAGSPKPWEAKSDSRFTALYLQYQQLTNRHIAQLN